MLNVSNFTTQNNDYNVNQLHFMYRTQKTYTLPHIVLFYWESQYMTDPGKKNTKPLIK